MTMSTHFRKRKIRTISSAAKTPQSSVWDFLLANSMSVRTFRGYDNFSSAHTTGSHSSEESGSPVIRKGVWLPNISVDSERRPSETPVVTSDDNVSVVTVERNPTPGPSGASAHAANPGPSTSSSGAVSNRL